MTGLVSLLTVVPLASLAGCQWPRDPEGTLDRVRNGTIRAGVVESEPWTRVTDAGEVTGVEAVLVGQLGRALGAQVEWFPGSEEELMAALHERQLDLVVGGLTSKAPWGKHVALTRAWGTTRTWVAVPRGGPVPQDIAGLRVAVEAGTAEAGRLRDTDAVPVPVHDVRDGLGGPVVVDEWRLDRLGLPRTDAQVSSSEHVMAVPMGENAWQTTVEAFLLDVTEDQLDRLLDAAAAARVAEDAGTHENLRPL